MSACWPFKKWPVPPSQQSTKESGWVRLPPFFNRRAAAYQGCSPPATKGRCALGGKQVAVLFFLNLLDLVVAVNPFEVNQGWTWWEPPHPCTNQPTHPHPHPHTHTQGSWRYWIIFFEDCLPFGLKGPPRAGSGLEQGQKPKLKIAFF